MKAIFFFVVLPMILIFFILCGVVRTQLEEASPNQSLFTKGSVTNLPDGFYKGHIDYIKVPWKGKKFDATAKTGINIFGENNSEKYPFTFYIGKGLRDTKKDVIKIDYTVKGNPFWMRFILDEITEYAPGKYIGKLHLRLVPFLPITLGYFYLEK